jgi:hypothetical protein
MGAVTSPTIYHVLADMRFGIGLLGIVPVDRGKNIRVDLFKR